MEALEDRRLLATVTVYPSNLDGWQLTTSDLDPGAPPPSAIFEPGPATPPLGDGSLEFRISPAGSDDAQARNTQFNGTLLSSLTALSYSTYVEQNNGGTSGTAGSGGQAPYIILNVDYDNNGTTDDLLFFEPVYQDASFFPSNPQGPVALNTWQTWNALNGGWYSVFGTAGSGPGTNVKPLSTFFDPALGGDADARIVNSATGSGGLRIVTGFGGPADWGNFIGNVDNVTVDSSGDAIPSTTYDFEPTPTITINDITANEGNAGPTSFTFTVTLSTPLSQTVTVNFATANGTATIADGDYVATSGIVTIAPNTTTQTITVQVNGDTKVEPDESFFVNLTNAVGATIDDAQGQGTIANDDVAVPTINVVKLTNGTDNNTAPGPTVAVGSTVTFTYIVTNPGSVPLSGVTVRDNNGTVANTGDDFNATFASGDTNANGLLDLAETWTFTASRIATAGQYTNVGTATGTPPVGAVVTDTDVDNHFGQVDEEPPIGLPECEVTTLNSPGAPGSATIEEDADNPGEQVLIVTGTSGKDTIVVAPQPRSHGRIDVIRNGRVIVTLISTEVPRIVIFGDAGNDTIVVSPALNQSATIFGDGGNDTIVGGSGDDQIDGGAGNDRIIASNGDDVVCGGVGNDIIVGGNGDDILGGDAGNDVINGGHGDDVLVGGDGNDKLDGAVGNDRLYGQAGRDRLLGGVGNNILVGGDGNDTIIARGGRNILIGGTGADTLTGSAFDDILIAGSTVHDENDAALQAILAEWTSGNSYDDRVDHIRFGTGENGAFVLDEFTVIDDGHRDTLIGSGGRDWFWVGNNDRIRDRRHNEQVN